jgi:[acyl-carrier-protein] S-malonyltransferase
MSVANPGKVRLSISDRFAATPEGRLYLAAKAGDIEGVHAACLEKPDLDILHPEFGSTPLTIACLHGHMECVHYLLEEKAELEQRNKFGWTALLTSCSKGNLMLSGYLISRGADVMAQDKLGRTPLHNAVAAGCDDLAKGLIEEKADVNARTKDGKTVLSIELGRPRRKDKELENILTSAMGLPFPKGYVKNMLGDLPPSFALLFPGQGSQRLGMLGWAEEHERAWPMIEKATEVLGYDLFDVTEMGPETRLNEIAVCQPAVFVANMCGLEWLRDQEGKENKDAAAAAGISSGELAALCAAGCFSFEDGVLLAKIRGELMQKAVADASEPQKMVSVVGLSEDEIEAICEEATEEKGGVCKMGNRLFPCGFALAGTAVAVDAVKALAKERGAQKISELKGCNAGYHTELMQSVEEPLRKHLMDMLKNDQLHSPEITVYSSQTGERWLPGTPALSIADGMIKGLTAPNEFEDACRAMIDDGVEFLWEIGPMKQIKGMMRHIDYTQWKNMKCIDC